MLALGLQLAAAQAGSASGADEPVELRARAARGLHSTHVVDKRDASLPASSREVHSQNCKSWCHDGVELLNVAWEQKCTFINCDGCTECSAVGSRHVKEGLQTSNPSSHSTQGHTSSESLKNNQTKLNSHSIHEHIFAEASGKGNDSPSLSCHSFCHDDVEVQRKAWNVRCTFAKCGGCAECLTDQHDKSSKPLGSPGDPSSQNHSTLGKSSQMKLSNHSSHGHNSLNASSIGHLHTTSRSETICPNNGVTACCKGDGFGAQYLALMSVFAFSLSSKVTFCVTPWSHIQHGVSALDDGNGATSMFSFVGGHLYGPPALPTTRKIESLYSHFEEYANRTSAIAQIRSFYFATQKPVLRYFLNSTNSIAVHIRRGDVTPRDVQRWTSIEQIAACIGKVIDLFKGKTTTVHVFSDGTTEQMAGLQQFHPVLHLRDNIKTAFHHMVQANALIMAKSSLSGTAAILRTNGFNFLADEGSECAD